MREVSDTVFAPDPDAAAPLSVSLSLSRPALLPHLSRDEPLHVLIRLTASPPHPLTPTPPHSPAPTPRHLSLVLDASGSMHRIVLEESEREEWRQVARERGDLQWGRVDGREGWLWSGRTLAELQARQRTPMQAALQALRRAGERLRPDDRLAVVAFADRPQVLVAAGDPDRAGRIRSAIATLSRGVDEQNLGNGTRLAEALRLALEQAVDGGRQSRDGSRETEGQASERAVDDPASGCAPDVLPTTDCRLPTTPPARLLLISDGLVEDRVAAGAWIERVADAGTPLSCIGVGDQFDEELMMWAADITRGRFCYAPAADALEAAVAEELDRLETIAARHLTLALHPLAGSLFRDLCQVAPDLSALHRLETDGATYRFSLGDLSAGREALFLAELSLPPLRPGNAAVLAVELTGESPTGEPLAAPPTEAAVRATGQLLAVEPDPATLDAVAAVHAYRAERRAQRALRRGQPGEATRHLRDTRQIVERLGHAHLAAELEAHAAALDAGVRPSAERSKRIKAETRRLLE
jgi:VWA domain-containing protein